MYFVYRNLSYLRKQNISMARLYDSIILTFQYFKLSRAFLTCRLFHAFIKGATKLYFTQCSCVAMILFNLRL